MEIIGISRGHQYSPNHIDNDTAIFNRTMAELQQLGHKSVICTELEFADISIPTTDVVVVSMARDSMTLGKLQQWQQAGIRIFNPPHGIRNCIRQPMTVKLIEAGVPHPVSWVVDVRQTDTMRLTYPCWIKRGDSHALVKEDVCYAADEQEAHHILEDFLHRGITTAIVNEHLDGDLVKFYGVLDTDFFHWFYPSPYTHSKFGLETINGEAQGLAFNPTILKQYADDAARTLDVPIYGGDAVVMKDGEVKLIDFNDWPSFAPCRDMAAEAIARHIDKHLV